MVCTNKKQILTAESNKISEQIQESCQAFEQVLGQLHRRRILAQTSVLQVKFLSLLFQLISLERTFFQEELKISRLAFTLVKERLIEQLEETYENRAKSLEDKVHELELSKRALEDAINIVDNEKKRLRADDTFDKQFPREFADVPSALQDALKRLLTKRAK